MWPSTKPRWSTRLPSRNWGRRKRWQSNWESWRRPTAGVEEAMSAGEAVLSSEEPSLTEVEAAATRGANTDFAALETELANLAKRPGSQKKRIKSLQARLSDLKKQQKSQTDRLVVLFGALRQFLDGYESLKPSLDNLNQLVEDGKTELVSPETSTDRLTTLITRFEDSGPEMEKLSQLVKDLAKTKSGLPAKPKSELEDAEKSINSLRHEYKTVYDQLKRSRSGLEAFSTEATRINGVQDEVESKLKTPESVQEQPKPKKKGKKGKKESPPTTSAAPTLSPLDATAVRDDLLSLDPAVTKLQETAETLTLLSQPQIRASEIAERQNRLKLLAQEALSAAVEEEQRQQQAAKEADIAETNAAFDTALASLMTAIESGKAVGADPSTRLDGLKEALAGLGRAEEDVDKMAQQLRRLADLDPAAVKQRADALAKASEERMTTVSQLSAKKDALEAFQTELERQKTNLSDLKKHQESAQSLSQIDEQQAALGQANKDAGALMSQARELLPQQSPTVAAEDLKEQLESLGSALESRKEAAEEEKAKQEAAAAEKKAKEEAEAAEKKAREEAAAAEAAARAAAEAAETEGKAKGLEMLLALLVGLTSWTTWEELVTSESRLKDAESELRAQAALVQELEAAGKPLTTEQQLLVANYHKAEAQLKTSQEQLAKEKAALQASQALQTALASANSALTVVEEDLAAGNLTPENVESQQNRLNEIDISVLEMAKKSAKDSVKGLPKNSPHKATLQGLESQLKELQTRKKAAEASLAENRSGLATFAKARGDLDSKLALLKEDITSGQHLLSDAQARIPEYSGLLTKMDTDSSLIPDCEAALAQLESVKHTLPEDQKTVVVSLAEQLPKLMEDFETTRQKLAYQHRALDTFQGEANELKQGLDEAETRLSALETGKRGVEAGEEEKEEEQEGIGGELLGGSAGDGDDGG